MKLGHGCRIVAGLMTLAVLGACAADKGGDAPVAEAVAAAPAPAVLTVSEASFSCIQKMTPVRGFFVANLMGNTDATVAAATAGSGVYPAGSVVQLVPGEAMVKLAPGASPGTKDWEFFELDATADGTKIKVRGFTEAVNQFGGNCLACHAKATADRDLICETGHGCDPLPLSPAMVKAIQKTDPRCEPMELTDDEKAGLQQLAAFRAAAAARPAQ